MTTESPRSISSKSTINESIRSQTGPMKNFSTTTIGSNRSLMSNSGVRKSRLNRRKGNSKNDEEIDQTYCSSELSNGSMGRKGASLKGKKSAEQLRKVRKVYIPQITKLQKKLMIQNLRFRILRFPVQKLLVGRIYQGNQVSRVFQPLADRREKMAEGIKIDQNMKN